MFNGNIHYFYGHFQQQTVDITRGYPHETDVFFVHQLGNCWDDPPAVAHCQVAQVVAGNLPTTRPGYVKIAIENDHRNSGFSY